MKIEREKDKIRQELMKEYEAKKLVDLEIDLMKVPLDIRTGAIKEIYKRGDLRFTQKYINAIYPETKNWILNNEFKNGNMDFVYSNFKYLEEGEIKSAILGKELENKNFEFLYKNYENIMSEKIKEKILNNAFKEAKIDFLNNHINDMSKNMKLEAAIKFKNFRISREELAILMKR